MSELVVALATQGFVLLCAFVAAAVWATTAETNEHKKAKRVLAVTIITLSVLSFIAAGWVEVIA